MQSKSNDGGYFINYDIRQLQSTNCLYVLRFFLLQRLNGAGRNLARCHRDLLV